MIKPIMKDPIFLSQKSVPATAADLPIAQDLRDTLAAHREGCVGMAANMIGINKRIIIFDDNGSTTVMFNQRSSNAPGLMRRRKAACLCPAREGLNVSARSRCSTRTSALKHG